MNQYEWRDHPDGYAQARVNGKLISMHRLVMGDPPDKWVDHKNRLVNDNRKLNLRLSNPSLNQANKKKSKNKSTKYKGVVKRSNGNYEVCISKDGRYMYLGVYTNVIAAANCYNYHAIKLFGEHARINDIDFLEKEQWEKSKSESLNSSIFKGVNWDNTRKSWRVRVNHKNKSIEYGYYRNENATANRYNIEALKLKGEDSVLNDIVPMSEVQVESFRVVRKKSSKYRGLRKTPSGKFAVRVHHNHQTTNLGTYEDEDYAAKIYNDYILDNNIDKELNEIPEKNGIIA